MGLIKLTIIRKDGQEQTTRIDSETVARYERDYRSETERRHQGSDGLEP